MHIMYVSSMLIIQLTGSASTSVIVTVVMGHNGHILFSTTI